MYTPSFKTKKNGVPVLDRKEIDNIGENFIRDFQPSVLTSPAPVDIENFTEFYLGMTPDYLYLSHNGIYLGMTVFNDTNKVPVYDPATNRAEYISAKARTVIIDNRLLEKNQEHRYRFTLGHECGHGVFHTAFFAYNPDQLSMFNSNNRPPMIQCRVDLSAGGQRTTSLRTDRDWMEFHANAFSSSILMPKTAIQLIAGCHKGYHKTSKGRMDLVNDVARTLNVSNQAASYRLKELGYFPKNDMTDYSAGTALSDFFDLI